MLVVHCTIDFVKTKRPEELSSTMEVFDKFLEQWRVLNTTGSQPKGLINGGCCVSPSHDLFAYGSTDDFFYRGEVYKLTSLEWSQLSKESDRNGPMKNTGCRMVYFDDDKIAVVGGYGRPTSAWIFIQKKLAKNGWTNCNEIHIFDTRRCK